MSFIWANYVQPPAPRQNFSSTPMPTCSLYHWYIREKIAKSKILTPEHKCITNHREIKLMRCDKHVKIFDDTCSITIQQL